MKKLIILILFTIFAVSCTNDKTIHFGNERVYGGDKYDSFRDVVSDGKGNFVFTGMTTSYGAGYVDGYMVKTDNKGKQLWQNSFGDAGDNRLFALAKAKDGGYVSAGYAEDNTEKADKNIYIVKVDDKGKLKWDKKIGGEGVDEAADIYATSDGGFIIAGYTGSFSSQKEISIYMVKIDSTGKEVWSRVFGGEKFEYGNAVVQTSDGGYLVGGKCSSFGNGIYDMYAIKTDADGNCRWARSYGNKGYDEILSVLEADDGYILAGSTANKDTSSDIYIVKIDKDGNELWNKTFGWLRVDYAKEVIRSNDGGYILGGVTESYGNGSSDLYIIKTDADGNSLWAKAFGGKKDEYLGSIIDTGQGYLIAGWTGTFGKGEYDGYVVNLDYNGNVK